jgi:hypothetical protein
MVTHRSIRIYQVWIDVGQDRLAGTQIEKNGSATQKRLKVFLTKLFVDDARDLLCRPPLSAGPFKKRR